MSLHMDFHKIIQPDYFFLGKYLEMDKTGHWDHIKQKRNKKKQYLL